MKQFYCFIEQNSRDLWGEKSYAKAQRKGAVMSRRVNIQILIRKGVTKLDGFPARSSGQDSGPVTLTN